MIYPYYNKLSTRSRRYWKKLANNPEKATNIKFRGNLIKRLSVEFNKDIDTVYTEMYKELKQWIKDYNANI